MPVATVRELFEERIPRKLQAHPDVVAKLAAVFQFHVSGPEGGSWYVDCAHPGGKVESGTSAAAACTVSVKDADLIALVNGELNPGMAFMTGKIKVQGDYGLAMKLSQVF